MKVTKKKPRPDEQPQQVQTAIDPDWWKKPPTEPSASSWTDGASTLANRTQVPLVVVMGGYCPIGTRITHNLWRDKTTGTLKEQYYYVKTAEPDVWAYVNTNDATKIVDPKPWLQHDSSFKNREGWIVFYIPPLRTIDVPVQQTPDPKNVVAMKKANSIDPLLTDVIGEIFLNHSCDHPIYAHAVIRTNQGRRFVCLGDGSQYHKGGGQGLVQVTSRCECHGEILA